MDVFMHAKLNKLKKYTQK